MPDVLTAARAASAVAERCADDGDRSRRLPQPVVEALAAGGLFTLCLPEAYGGPGSGPVALIDGVDEVARGVGEAGRCTALASTTSSMGAFLPHDVAGTIFTSTATATGGVFAAI